MSDSESRTGKELKTTPPTSVTLSPSADLDLSWLPADERKALLVDYSQGILDIHKRAKDLHVDVAALDATLRNLSATTQEMTESGNAVTISHTQTTSIGRTEVIMGNTDQAQRGKLTSSQTGQRDLTIVYIIAGLIAFVVIAALLGN